MSALVNDGAPVTPASPSPVLAIPSQHKLRRPVIQAVVLVIGELGAFIAAAAIATGDPCRGGEQSVCSLADLANQKILLVYGLLMLGWFIWFGLVKRLYTHRKPFWSELGQVLVGVVTFALIHVALVGVFNTGQSLRQVLVAWFCLMVLLPLARQASRRFLMRFGLWTVPTIIIGQGVNAKEAYLALQSEPNMGFKVHAFAVILPKDERRKRLRGHPPVEGVPLLSLSLQPEDLAQLQGFNCLVAMDNNESKFRDTVLRSLNQNKIADVHVIPSMRGVPLYGMETFNFFSHEVLLIQLHNNSASALLRGSKRLFDIVCSATLLMLLSPIFMILAYKVTRDGGKAFYGHERVGNKGKLFKCYKFRSMVANSQEVLAHLLATDPVAKAEWDLDFKLKNDPRVNKLGALMRRTSLDELPQLWNVLKGEMSMVGPRPVVKAELARFGDDTDYYLMVHPGITGLWQVSGRSDLDYVTRVYLDAWYVKNWSLWTDVAILFKTFAVVFGRKGAY